MPTPFGSTTKTFILKSESHKLHEEFEVDYLKTTLTAGGTVPMVTGNVINGKVNNVPIAAVTFNTDHATTMGLIAAAITALGAAANVLSASVTSTNVITVRAIDGSLPLILHEWVTTSGATQCTWSYSINDDHVHKGQLVKLTTDGKVEPYAAGDIPQKALGICVQEAHGGDLVTVMMRAFAVVYAEAYAASHTAGTCRLAAWNAANSWMEVDDGGTQDHTTIIGNCLDAAAADGDVVRVAISL